MKQTGLLWGATTKENANLCILAKNLRLYLCILAKNLMFISLYFSIFIV